MLISCSDGTGRYHQRHTTNMHYYPFLVACVLFSVLTRSIPIASSIPVQSLESGNPLTSTILQPSLVRTTTLMENATNLTEDLQVDRLGAVSTICLIKEKSAPFRPAARPKFNDCALALRQLPSSAAVEDFCTIAARAPHDCLIPVTKTHETCKVEIKLLGYGITERSSWLEIGMAANQLNMGCFSMQSPWMGTSGGTTTAGQTSRIQITMGNA